MRKIIFPLFICLIILSSCERERFYSGKEPVLRFSEDTLTFDTVFTSVGSVTRYFKVENTKNEALKIDKIRLKGLPGTQFRMNVDGEASSEVNDIEIPAKDYIYIFAEVTIDPNNTNNPFVVLDEIEYQYNGIIQQSYLRAWGQNAYFHYGEIITGDSVWDNDKPHVVVRNDSFPGVGIESFGSLEIKPGCQVYFSSGSAIFSDGLLTIGAPNCADSVVLQSDRIENLPNGLIYDDEKGLWFGIVLRSGAEGLIYNTIINNASYGIMGRWLYDDFFTFTSSNQPEIVLENVTIKNTSNTALFCMNTKLTARNTIFYNAGNALATLAMGGVYDFTNASMYHTGEQAALTLSNYASNGSQGLYGDLTAANFKNCIIYGGKTDELSIFNESAADFNFGFNHCLLRTSLNTDTTTYVACLNNQNPNFKNPTIGNLSLSNSSPCIGAGIQTNILFDYHCIPHNNPPDLGALSY